MEENISTRENFVSFDEQIKETEIEKKLSIPAKRLMEKLQPIPSKIESLQFRLFWELIQNASDFNSEVDIELELKEDTLIFRHNGKPFKLVDVENLITPDSDKDDEDLDEDYIGRFGSGFISTHALSAVITVEGLVKDKYRDDIHYNFKFDLDRSNYNSKKLLIDSIQKSEDQFKKGYKPSDYVSGSFDTIFTYDLTKSLSNTDSKEIAKSGIVYAIKVLPLVFTFLPKLKSVKFIDHNNSLQEKLFYQKKKEDSSGLCEIGFNINSVPQNDIKVKYAKEEEVIVAREIKDNLVKEYSEDIAILFLYLPLIGSEKFPFPISINSAKFKPETERHAISISDNDIENRNNLLNGVKAYKKLLQNLAEQEIGNLYHLVQLKSDRIKALPIGSDWFQKNIEKEIKLVLDEVEFVNCNGKPISYAKLKLPFLPDNKTESRDLEFYDTVSALLVNEVPSREEFLHWLKNIDFTIFKNVPFRLEAAVKLVEEASSLSKLSEKLKKNEENTVMWLAKFIKYVKENENGLLTRYKIIPCQAEEGRFVNRDAEIYMDNGVDANLIEVYNKMKNQDYRFKLLNKTINKEVANLLPETKFKTWGVIAKEIDDIFRIKLDSNSKLSKDELEGLSKLLMWLKEKGFPNWTELPTHFPTFNSSYTNFFLESFDEQERIKAITIRDSGKQDSLLKLAESEVTVEELNKVIESISEIKQIVNIIDSGANLEQLTELSKLFPNGVSEQVMNYAKEDARKKKDFSNLLEVGSKVEQLFIKTLEGYQITNDIIHAGGGAYDIRIYNPVTNKSFYIELKSCRYQNTDPINIAVSQAKRAVKELDNENFSIVIIERPSDNNMNEDYIKLNTKYFKNPGRHLSSIGRDFDIIMESVNTSNKVDLKMDNTEFKGSLDYKWVLEEIDDSGFEELLIDINKILK
jgi:hypothetical protein